jgi:hypothetical protein
MAVHLVFHIAPEKEVPRLKIRRMRGTQLVFLFLFIDLGNSGSASHRKCEQNERVHHLTEE